MLPCLEGEGCDLLINRSGWTCTQPGGRVKTTTVRMPRRAPRTPEGELASGGGSPWGGGPHVGRHGDGAAGLVWRHGQPRCLPHAVCPRPCDRVVLSLLRRTVPAPGAPGAGQNQPEGVCPEVSSEPHGVVGHIVSLLEWRGAPAEARVGTPAAAEASLGSGSREGCGPQGLLLLWVLRGGRPEQRPRP